MSASHPAVVGVVGAREPTMTLITYLSVLAAANDSKNETALPLKNAMDLLLGVRLDKKDTMRRRKSIASRAALTEVHPGEAVFMNVSQREEHHPDQV